MIEGQNVIYHRSDSKQTGTVVKISGVGDSFAKLLDLRVDDNTIAEKVPHQRDYIEGDAHFWTLRSEKVFVVWPEKKSKK